MRFWKTPVCLWRSGSPFPPSSISSFCSAASCFISFANRRITVLQQLIGAGSHLELSVHLTEGAKKSPAWSGRGFGVHGTA